jgi:ATP-dependent DNA helicase RecG
MSRTIQKMLDFPPPPVERLQLLGVEDIFAEADQELLEKLKEDRRIERKPPATHADALGDYFSMWANTAPDGGLIAIGIGDKGDLIGCNTVGIDHINNLEKSGDTFAPEARYTSKRIPVINQKGEQDFITLVRVLYRTDRLVETVRGNAFVRRGDSKRKLTDDEKRELELDKGQGHIELEPSGLDYPQDFDVDLIKQFITNVRDARDLPDRLTDMEILELRHLGKRDSGKFIPNLACSLLFAKDPNRLIPGSRIRFLRFEGEHEGAGERFNAVKDIWIEGQLARLILEAEKVLDSQVRNFTRLSKDGKFHTSPEYPKLAWYEAVVNACVHRSYNLKNMNIFIKMFDDRLIIESPGGFPPLVTPENIYDVHHPRNPHLMDAMYYLKYVKCAHEGTRRIRDSMAEMDLPAPEFAQKEISNALVRVTLRNNMKQRKVWVDSAARSMVGEQLFNTLTENERRAINYVAEFQTINVSDLQRQTGLSWEAAKKVLMGLKKKHVLEEKRRRDLARDPKAHFVLKATHPPE